MALARECDTVICFPVCRLIRILIQSCDNENERSNHKNFGEFAISIYLFYNHIEKRSSKEERTVVYFTS